MEISYKIDDTYKKSIFNILPLEIIELILELIKNTELILRLRLVNKYFYNYYLEVPNYLRGYQISKYCFFQNKWYKKSNNNQILKKNNFSKIW
jgi:hypothetical protein